MSTFRAILPVLIAAGGAASGLALGRTDAESLAFGTLLGVAAASWFAHRSSAARSPALSAAAAPPDERRQLIEVALAVADANPDALVLFDEDGTIRYVNPAARELFFEGVEPVGKNFLRLLSQAPDTLREVLLGETDRLFTLEVDRQPETFHLTRRNFEIAEGLKTLIVVKHLTREVARREVQTLKNVVRVISHEVNNSLAPIASMVHSARLIAKKPEHAAKLGSVFDTIEERASHLASFLEGYASLARLPAPQSRQVSWKPLFDQLHVIHPELRLPEPPERSGYFDSVQIEQVLINLVKNAVEAGSPRDQIAIAAQVDAEGATWLEVADAGPGFTDEALSSALLPFYTTKEKGSGMGLALSREIVQAHGGSLALSNREQGGARVSIVLPGERKPNAAVSRSRAKLTLSRV